MVRKGIAAALIGAALLAAPFAVSAKDVEMVGDVGMPNPIVEYSSYNELSRVVGFHPLFFPACAMQVDGFTVDSYSAIDGKTGQMFFSNKKGQKLLVRTAKITADNPRTDISGVYTDKWKPVDLGGTVVQVAKLPKNGMAAHWTVGDYAFSLYGEKMKEKDFLALLQYTFLDVSQHVFSPVAQAASIAQPAAAPAAQAAAAK